MFGTVFFSLNNVVQVQAVLLLLGGREVPAASTPTVPITTHHNSNNRVWCLILVIKWVNYVFTSF
jgi:hypothetical protein